jgi:hypothetical protein
LPWSTVEVRWFFEGALEETGRGVEAWFRARAHAGSRQPAPIAWEPAPPAWRQDRYLVVPGHDDMGIKWREGRLEIKGREAALGPRVFAPGIEGRCERWIKWSYAGDRVAQRFLDLFHDDRSVDGAVLIEKRRLQRLFRLDDRGETTEVGGVEPRERGVNVELTRIRVRDRPEAHWSLAFEAFPGDVHTAEMLAPIVARFLEGFPVMPLAADRSRSYPRWLSDLAAVALRSD